jgi:TRAP-type transport system periplasmic protein
MKRYSCLLAFFVALIFGAVLPLTVSAQEKVITLKYASFFPASHKNSILSEEWCKEVERRAKGRVKIRYYPEAILTPPQHTFDAVLSGIADIGQALMGYNPGRFPLSQGIDLPLGYKSGLIATRMANEFYRKFKPKEFDEVKVLYLHAHGPGVLNTKRPVAKLEDIRGLRIRAAGETVQTVKALGGSPVALPQNETMYAMLNGVVDGAMSPIEAMRGFRLGEVATNHTLNFSSAYSSGFYVVMNKAKWNSLPPDIQKIIDETSQKWVEKQGKLWDEIDSEGYAFIRERGNRIITLSKEE